MGREAFLSKLQKNRCTLHTLKGLGSEAIAGGH